MRFFTTSFPSGHATVSAVVYLTLAALSAPLCSDRRIAVLCIVTYTFLTLLVGVSRVYLGVHYLPTAGGLVARRRLGAAVLGRR